MMYNSGGDRIQVRAGQTSVILKFSQGLSVLVQFVLQAKSHPMPAMDKEQLPGDPAGLPGGKE